MARVELSQRLKHRGYTLVELLIVLLIAVMLVATALPIAATVLEDARVREGSRALNAYCAMAKSRAALTGRPCGLMLVSEAAAGTGYYQSTQLYLAEEAEAYGGSSLPAARAQIVSGVLKFYSYNTGTKKYDTEDTTEATYLKSLLGARSLLGKTTQEFLIRFDFKGDWFYVDYDPGTGTFTYNNKSLMGTTSPPNQPLPFQIRRLPAATGSAMAMPQGTAIDFLWSGFGAGDNTTGINADRGDANAFRQGSKLVLVMFSPAGGVDSVFVNDQLQTNQGTIHFLVGRTEKTGQFGVDSNLADPTSLWVSIGRRTGIAVTSENTPDDDPGTALDESTDPTLVLTRSVATNREQTGGR